MNLQIKALLLLSFLWRCITSVQAQTVLQQENNLFRDGDAVLKQELHYKHPGRSGKNVIWDFSELALLNRGYQEQYIGSIDTLLTRITPTSKYKYKLVGNSLFCIGYKTPTLQIKYLLPELYCRYPMYYGDSIFSLYYGEGKYSHTVNVSTYGRSIKKVDASGTIIIPDGDTLTNVLRIYDSLHIGQCFSAYQDILSCGDSTRYSSDSILYRLSHDSITWQVDSYRWYAPGYRYPIFETIHTSIISTGVPTRHFNRSYYYPPEEQKYLPEDNENMNIRDSIIMWETSNPSPIFNSLKDSKMKQNYVFNHYIDEEENTLRIELLLKEDASVELLLCSLVGYCLEHKRYNSASQGIHIEYFNISSLAPGNYLLSLIVNDEIRNIKITIK